MPCTPIPKASTPTLPANIRLTPPIPDPPVPNVPGTPCCILPATQKPKIPVPQPPGVMNPAFAATLHAALQTVESYLSSLPLDCPRQ